MNERSALRVLRCLLVLALPAAASAEQRVLLDITYTHAGAGAEPSHKHLKPPYPGGETPPTNWLSPIDWATGKVHLRLEVKTKPTTVKVQYETCFVQSGGYGCLGAYSFTTVGVYEWDKDLPAMWQYSDIDWATNAVSSEIAMVVKDANGNKIERNDPTLYPMDLRYVITLVSKGSAYTPTVPMETPDAGISVPPSPPTNTGGVPNGTPDSGTSTSSPDPELLTEEPLPTPANAAGTLPSGPPADAVGTSCTVAGEAFPACSLLWALLAWRRRLSNARSKGANP
jgi:hypothetical protein